jgi:hypothetical protein
LVSTSRFPLTRGVARAVSFVLMAAYTYILRCGDEGYYYGSTSDLV